MNNLRFAKRSFLFWLIAATTTNLAHSQVTIGDTSVPQSGALLQLKDNGIYSKGETATKGLGLPKVVLTSFLDLYPMFDDDGAGGYKIDSQTYVKADQDAAHVGLLVYNVNPIVSDNCDVAIEPSAGLYVWNGTQWQILNGAGVGYYVDTRVHGGAMADAKYSKVYRYRTFGAAGTWMLENMRYIPADNSIKASGGTNTSGKYYTYPQANVVMTNAQAAIVPSTWSEAQGLLYTYEAATLGSQTSVKSDQGVASASSTPGANEIENTSGWPIAYQGICPSGWHIPSDREWNKLEEVIQNSMSKYATATSSVRWTSAWNSTGTSGKEDQGDNLDPAMASACVVPNSLYTTNGKSFSAAEGGFAVWLVGNSNVSTLYNYGTFSYLWSSSRTAGGDAWIRRFGYKQGTVLRHFSNNFNLYSVRCKRDE